MDQSVQVDQTDLDTPKEGDGGEDKSSLPIIFRKKPRLQKSFSHSTIPSPRSLVKQTHTLRLSKNPFLARLLAYPDPVLDHMEETVRKLEEELGGIEERFLRASSASRPQSPSSSAPPPHPQPPPHHHPAPATTTTAVSRKVVPQRPPPAGEVGLRRVFMRLSAFFAVGLFWLLVAVASKGRAWVTNHLPWYRQIHES